MSPEALLHARNLLILKMVGERLVWTPACWSEVGRDCSLFTAFVARVYRLLILVLGLSVLAAELASWQSTDILQFSCYLVLTVLAAGFRVCWRTPHGSLPLAFFFVLIGIMQFSRSEGYLMAACAGLAVALPYAPPGRRIFSALFEISAMSMAATMAHFALQAKFVNMESFNGILQVLASGVFFFLGQTFPYAAIEGLTKRLSILAQWTRGYFWMLPYYVGGAGLSGALHYTSDRLGGNGWRITIVAFPVAYLLVRSYNLYLARMEDSRGHAEEMASLHLRTIEALALAIDAKDATTHDHLQRVQVYAIELGRELNLSAEDMEALRAASLLHDIGKLAVPEHIISKPGRLTPEEFEKMKIHPVVGAEILERVGFPYPVVPIVRSHHEKWNGAGYPDGLKGEDIPIGARILSAVDCLDALASDRQYRKALPLDQAMAVVIKDAGTAFDPRVVEVLARRYVELERKAQEKHVEPLKLSTELKIERGAAPAAGFEVSSTDRPADFLNRIAAARQEAQTLYELAQHLGSSLSLDETLSVLGVRVQKLVPFDACAVWLRRLNHLEPAYVSGDNFRLLASLEIPVGQGLSGWVAENSKPILNGNPSVEPGYIDDPSRYAKLSSAIAVPLEGVNGIVGVLTLYHRNKDAFTRDHLRILQAISGKLALAVENAVKFKQAESARGADVTTGLPNTRSLFLHLDAELSRCRRQGDPLAVMVFRIEQFHAVHQERGQAESDRLLATVAAELKTHCREYDYVASLGGGEFVLVLPGLRLSDTAPRSERMAAELLRATGIVLQSGVAHCPEDGANAEELLAEADRRLHKSRLALSPPAKREQRDWTGAPPISTTIQ
jgi:diguanylate cyclase (GGDEF)-like protein/putative nucleotidyltransferase with HDIG domain